jgi:carbonic anhydrase
MSCTAPLNIVQNLQTDKICKLKCAYQFTYAHTSLQIHNKGSYLSFMVDEAATPPVIYNDQNYTVNKVVLVQPSIHQFTGKKTDAELIITHTNVNNDQLCVCVPVKASSTSTSNSANYFDMIISAVAQTAPSMGGHATFNNSSFNLSSFVPMKPYFSYTGTDMNEQTCSSRTVTVDYIVYHPDNAITMTPAALETLKRVIPRTQTFGAALSESSNPGGVFYNPSGPGASSQPDIYIDCKLVGDDGEVLVPIKSNTNNNLLNNPFVQKLLSYGIIDLGLKFLIGLILMVVLWVVMVKVVKGITASVVKTTKI